MLAIRELPERPGSLWYKTAPELFERHYRLKAAPELYDLSEDAGEKRNVAGRHPAIVKELEGAAGEFDRGVRRDKRGMVHLG